MSLIVRRPARTALPDAGPSPIRYLAVLSGRCLAVLVTVVLMPFAGHGLRGDFCGQGDTGCAPRTIAAAAETHCRVLSHADVVPDDAVVFTDDLGTAGRLTLSRTVDKSAVVHWFVRRDNVPGSERGGELTEFPTENAARAYITSAQHEPVRLGLAGADPTGLLARIAGTVDGYALPRQMVKEPHAYFVDAGSAMDLGPEARSGVGGAIISGGVTGISEVRVTQEKRPMKTLFVRLSSTAATQLKLGGAGSGMTVASVAFDREGLPRQLVLETAGEIRGWLRPSAEEPAGLMESLLAEAEPSEPEPFTGRVSIRIDLRAPEVAGAVADALHALGVPLLLDLGTENAPAPLPRLYGLLDAGAPGTSVTVSAYRWANDEVTGNDPLLVGLGMQGGLTVKGALPGDDFYYAPGQGLVRWQTCGP
jgi:hypothetical protein